MFTKLISVTVFSSLFFVKTSLAADCPSGQFCVWTDAGFKGERSNWSGDDGNWEVPFIGNDSSWANNGIVGPGIKSYVKVYSSEGEVTICLASGEEVTSNSFANDRGVSHEWAMGC